MPISTTRIKLSPFPKPSSGAILYDAGRFNYMSSETLDSTCYIHKVNANKYGGRNAAWFISYKKHKTVLRYYNRGGLVGSFNPHFHLWRGINRVRSFLEFRIITSLKSCGISVPSPLAATYWRYGLVYRAAILTERVLDAYPLAHTLTRSNWESAARMIAKMHRNDFWHADLNVFNILLNPMGQVWIIDFDLARQGKLTQEMREANLLRLYQSAKKVMGPKGTILWEHLYNAYCSS